MEKAREFQKNVYFSFIDYAKAFDCLDHNKLWKILKEMGIPDHLTCLLRNLYVARKIMVNPIVTWNVHKVIFIGRGTLGTDKMKEEWFLEDCPPATCGVLADS